MWSTPRRCSEASQACRTYSASPRMPRRSPCSLRTLPNFVASTTWSRRPAMARPTSRSLVNGPYASAVSRKDTQVERPVDGRDRLALVAAAVELRHAHAAQADLRDLEPGASQVPLPHGSSNLAVA